MTRSYRIVFALALVSVGASGYWWWSERTRWSPPLPKLPALPEVAKLEAAPRHELAHSLARPLFWSSRKPVAANADGGADAPQPENEITTSRLTAVLEMGDHKIALLQKADGTIIKLGTQEGEYPWRLASFDGRTALFLSRSGEKVERLLERTATPAPPAPLRPDAERRADPSGRGKGEGGASQSSSRPAVSPSKARAKPAPARTGAISGNAPVRVDASISVGDAVSPANSLG